MASACVRRTKEALIDLRFLQRLLEGVHSGEISTEEALERLRTLPYEDLDFAKLDHHRALRKGFPEVIFGQGKQPDQIAILFEKLAQKVERALVTRASPEAYEAVRRRVPEAAYNDLARTITLDRLLDLPRKPGVAVICAGTADLPVAEEATVTAHIMGSAVERFSDVGAAGIHRLFDHLPAIQRAKAVVVVAGMEGALPSIVSGLIAAPVVAVPTSVGYGASFEGLAALLAMLNSCAPGVAVMNIDNGFGAGYLAARINAQSAGEL